MKPNNVVGIYSLYVTIMVENNLQGHTKKGYNLGEEISDLGCRLRNLECGVNKKFITVEEFSAEHDPNIKGCIERCSCILPRPDGCMQNF